MGEEEVFFNESSIKGVLKRDPLTPNENEFKIVNSQVHG